MYPLCFFSFGLPVELTGGHWSHLSLLLLSGPTQCCSAAPVEEMPWHSKTASLWCLVMGFLLAGLIEQRDSQPLLRLIESIGDWPIASDDWNATTGNIKLTIESNQILRTNIFKHRMSSQIIAIGCVSPQMVLSLCLICGLICCWVTIQRLVKVCAICVDRQYTSKLMSDTDVLVWTAAHWADLHNYTIYPFWFKIPYYRSCSMCVQ